MTDTDAPPDALMLFDGVCHLCDGVVRTVMRLDRHGVIRFTPTQSPFGRRLATRYGLDPDAPESFLFLDRGRPLRKTAAVAALLRRLPVPWRWFASVERLPRGVTDRAYDWVAAHRYRIFGKDDQCQIPTPELRGRFLLD